MREKTELLRFSMLENKTILIKHSISEFLFFWLFDMKAFPVCAVHPAHRMPNVAVTGRKRPTVSGLIRLVISLECFIEITPDFLCPFMND